MQPQLFVVSLLALCMPAARACLQCDRKTRLLHEDFLLSAASMEDQIELTLIRDHAYVTYRETSQAHRGVIDSTTFYRASTEYYSEFDRFKKTQHTGSGTFEAIQIMEKGRKILEKHLDMFIREGLCPNKCGQLYQRVIDCSSCKYRFYNCSSPTHQLDCGEHHVKAEEGGEAVLNCFLPWHSLLQGRPEYHYTWAPGHPGTKQLEESDFQKLVVTEEASVVLNQLRVDEQGTYRCSLQDHNATVFSTVTFLLTVTVMPTQTPMQPIALPTLPPRYTSTPFPLTRTLLLSIIATVTALSLVASIGLTVALGSRRYFYTPDHMNLGLTMKWKIKERRVRQMVSVC